MKISYIYICVFSHFCWNINKSQVCTILAVNKMYLFIQSDKVLYLRDDLLLIQFNLFSFTNHSLNFMRLVGPGIVAAL